MSKKGSKQSSYSYCKRNLIINMLGQIRTNVSRVVDALMFRLYHKSYNDFILLIARGQIIPGLERVSPSHSNYSLDYMLDEHYDETREKYYVEYLNSKYKKDGFDYRTDDGFFCLNIELMIYCHIWESSLFLKSLKHITDLLTGQEYDWGLELPDMKIKPFIKDSIIKPLVDIENEFGQLLKKAYSPNLRNSFAHSLYHIDMECRKIYLYIKRPDEEDCVGRVITFEEFQEKFLYSISLCYLLRLSINHQRDMAANSHGGAITKAFKVPSGRMMQIFADYKEIKGKRHPVFSGVLIKERVHRFKVGDWVKFEGLQTPIEVIAVKDTETEQFVKLKGARKMCSSTILTFTTLHNETMFNHNDHQIIKLFLD